MAFYRFRIKQLPRFSWIDFLLLVGLALFVYLLIGAAEQWASPYRPRTDISLSFGALLQYSVYSSFRVFASYVLSLVFTIAYGYAAAKSKLAEPFLVSLLDILQSVPVLGFMPGLVLALVSVFPGSNLGLELAAIVMIFTGQAWNMVFSFYTSLKNVPSEFREISRLYQMNRWELLRNIELPYSMNGLLWNSMLSMAGGWFFLMVIESFALGDKSFRLPGIGSYMAVAYEQGDVGAILLGIGVIFSLIILVDRCLWAPLVVWSERFRFDVSPNYVPSHSFVLDLLKRSDLLAWYFEQRDRLWKKIQKQWNLTGARAQDRLEAIVSVKGWMKTVKWILTVAGALGVGWAVVCAYRLLIATDGETWLLHFRDTFLTFLRVLGAVLLGSLWAIPVGVAIGTQPTWTRRLQPIVQVVASFPAPMLFPLITMGLMYLGVSLELGAVVLMVFAAQWYILFNVISGATMIPNQFIEMAESFNVRGMAYWRSIVLPSIFPSLVNGWITAAGGAWNACIVSEFVQLRTGAVSATGIGAAINQAAQVGDFPRLAGGILTMVTTVVLLNRFFWDSLYRLAESKYRLEP